MCRPLRSPRATCLFVFILQPNRQPSRRVPVFGDFVFAAWAYLAIARARASFVICLRCFALRRRSHLRANACLPPCSLAGSVPQALAEALTYDCLFHPQEFEEETPKPLSWSCDFSAFHLFLGARKALPVFSVKKKARFSRASLYCFFRSVHALERNSGYSVTPCRTVTSFPR